MCLCYSTLTTQAGCQMNSLSMMTSSNGNIFRVTGNMCGEFTGLRWIPRTKASDAELWCFLYLRLKKPLSKQSLGWWVETLLRPLWRHCNATHTGRGTVPRTVLQIEQVNANCKNITPHNKVHGANMGPIWGRRDPGGPHVGPMSFASWHTFPDLSHRMAFCNLSTSQWLAMYF